MTQREIKFRAWDKQEKRFVEFGPLYGLKEQTKKLVDDGIFEIQQFTGLKDKNGKEIYEGDIVQFKRYSASRPWWRTTEEIPRLEQMMQEQRDAAWLERNVVKFEDGGFCLDYSIIGKHIRYGERFESGSHNSGDFENKDWDFEVIGNIYENPELLKA